MSYQDPNNWAASGYPAQYPSAASGPYPQYSTYPAPTVYQDPSGTPYQMMPVYQVAQPPADGMSIAGMVLGIISVAGGWITIVMPFIGLGLSIAGQHKVSQQGRTSGQAIAGIVCNGVAVLALISIAIMALMARGLFEWFFR